MSDEKLTRDLEHLLDQSRKSSRVFAAERAHYKRIAREQNIQLAIGRLKIDAGRAALEAQIAAGRARKRAQ